MNTNRFFFLHFGEIKLIAQYCFTLLLRLNQDNNCYKLPRLRHPGLMAIRRRLPPSPQGSVSWKS